VRAHRPQKQQNAMIWLELSVEVDGEAAEAVAEALRPYAYGGVAIEQIGGPLPALQDEWAPQEAGEARYAVRIYIPEDQAAPMTLRRAQEALWHLGQLYPIPAPQVQRLAEEDWAEAWKTHFTVTRVGRRLVIVPAWQSYTPRPEDIVIALDPGMAFGTGLHPTTQMCLTALEALLQPGMSVLDIGTGSGILALAAAKLGAAQVLAVDTDTIAVAAARANVRLNQVEGVVRVEHGSLEVVGNSAWDLVLVNILAPVIVRLLDAGLGARVRAGGILVAAGLIAEQAPEVIAALRRAGLTLSEQRQIKDWVTLIATAPRPSAPPPPPPARARPAPAQSGGNRHTPARRAPDRLSSWSPLHAPGQSAWPP
jgi:ribosomal protein L11 methyltransferase